ncbi:GntR family transcriptional regulator, partial [Listeria grayi]|uniref:Transcriptional regulator, GntR family protein n=1 Tax=Listeria grayi FSL F6-1183 TaxID=1265827 RepID=A0A829R3E9_LISGR
MKGNNIKYVTVYNHLKQDIISGKYPVGSLFPAEPDLQKHYNVSRITIRHSLQLLVDEGYIKRIHGVGTIVLSQKRISATADAA